MGTRLTLVIETELDADALRQAVADWDAEEGEEGIDPAHVKAWDIITAAVMGKIAFVPIANHTKWVEGMPDLRDFIADHGGDLSSLDGVVIDRIETMP